MHTLKAIDSKAVQVAAKETRLIVTVEEHTIRGGLGSAVAEILASLPSPRARLVCAGVPDAFLGEAYSQEGARTKLRLDASGLYKNLEAILSEDL